MTARRSVDSVTAAWLLLMAATIVTTWVLTGGILGGVVATAVTLLIAGWKVRLVMRNFMELRDAGWIARLVMEIWALGVTSMLLAFYLSA